MVRQRRHKVAEVTLDAAQGWKAFARTHRVTQAALAEAIGLWLGEVADLPRSKLPPQLRRCIDHAGEITYENRQRGDSV